MDPNQQTDDTDYTFELADDENAEESVDDFIRQLEAKEKDLHITAETTFIEIAADFEEGDVPDFLKQDTPPSGSTTLKPTVAATTSHSADSASVKKLEKEIAELKSKVADLQEERSELYTNSQRRLKDFEAYKARTERERGDTFQRQLRNLATQMLPALDNLDRALLFASEMPEERQSGFAQFFDGIVLVNQQVNEVLVNMGIDPIATVGHPFDPHYHEAVAIDENSDLPPNTITAELLRGFRIGDSVIRHSMVKVSKPASGGAQNADAMRDAISELNSSDHSASDDAKSLADLAPDTSGGSAPSNDEFPVIDFEIERNGDFD